MVLNSNPKKHVKKVMYHWFTAIELYLLGRLHLKSKAGPAGQPFASSEEIKFFNLGGTPPLVEIAQKVKDGG